MSPHSLRPNSLVSNLPSQISQIKKQQKVPQRTVCPSVQVAKAFQRKAIAHICAGESDIPPLWAQTQFRIIIYTSGILMSSSLLDQRDSLSILLTRLRYSL